MREMPELMIEARDLHRSFKNKETVAGINFTARRSEISGLKNNCWRPFAVANRLLVFLMPLLFMPFHHRTSGNLGGSIPIASTLFRRFFDMLVLTLLFRAHPPQRLLFLRHIFLLWLR